MIALRCARVKRRAQGIACDPLLRPVRLRVMLLEFGTSEARSAVSSRHARALGHGVATGVALARGRDCRLLCYAPVYLEPRDSRPLHRPDPAARRNRDRLV